MSWLPKLFDADDTREKYFSGATWAAQVPNSGIRDGATKYMGPRETSRTGIRADFLTYVVQQEINTLVDDLRAQVAEEQATLEYLSEYEDDYELSMCRTFLPDRILSSVDMNPSLTDWCYEYRMCDTHIRPKSIDDRRHRPIPSLEAAVKAWREELPSLTPDSFYELETAVISLHPSD